MTRLQPCVPESRMQIGNGEEQMVVRLFSYWQGQCCKTVARITIARLARERCSKDTRTPHRSSTASNSHFVKPNGSVFNVQMACRETLSQVAELGLQ
jgi:hypothetical protein